VQQGVLPADRQRLALRPLDGPRDHRVSGGHHGERQRESGRSLDPRVRQKRQYRLEIQHNGVARGTELRDAMQNEGERGRDGEDDARDNRQRSLRGGDRRQLAEQIPVHGYEQQTDGCQRLRCGHKAYPDEEEGAPEHDGGDGGQDRQASGGLQAAREHRVDDSGYTE
jgi:hypothetical protein